MDESDFRIMENELARIVGQAVSKVCKKNGYFGEATVTAEVMKPSCYIDGDGVTHTGSVIIVNVDFSEEDDDDDDE